MFCSFIVVFKRNLVDIRSYKNRFHSFGKNFKFKFGQYALICLNEAVLELVQLGFLKKILKKILKKKKKFKGKGKYKKKKKGFRLKNVRIEGIIGKVGKHKRKKKNTKVWMSLWPNHILSRKSKNARMGKGKGNFNRWCLKIKRNTTVLESIGLPRFILNTVVFNFNKKSKLKLCVVSNIKFDKQLRIWCDHKISFLYFNKFRVM